MTIKRLCALLLLLTCTKFIWGADGDTFEYTTNDGYTLNFFVLSEAEKKVQLGLDHYPAVAKKPSNSYRATLTIPENVWHGNNYTVTAIGKDAFYQEQWLKKVIIPETVTDIGESAFCFCSNLSEINLPRNIKTIQEFTFFYTALENIDIPEGVDSIKRSAFNGSFLKSLVIPSTVKYIHSVSGEHAFKSAIRLSSVKVDKDNAVYDSRNDCNSIIEKSTLKLIRGCCNTVIPDGVKVIGGNAMDYAYYSQERKDSYYGLTSAGKYSVVLPESVIELEDNCFYECNELRKITLPKNLNKIGDWTFYGCSSLDTIVSYIIEPFEIDSHNFEYWSNGKQQTLYISPVIYVPKGSSEKYRQTVGWNLAREIIEMPSPIITFFDANVKRICVSNWDTNNDGELDENEAAAVTELYQIFTGNTDITSFDELQYFTGLTSIGQSAFNGCHNLKSLVIPNNVSSIGWMAFYGCSNLQNIVLPDGINNIGIESFKNCCSLTMFVMPKDVVSVGWSAFEGCSSLQKVVVNDLENWCKISFGKDGNPLKYAHHMYIGDEEVTDLIIPGNIQTIRYGSFEGCTGLKSVFIHKDVKRIDYGAFNDCTGLERVNIEDLEAWCKIEFGSGDDTYSPLYYAHHLFWDDEEITDLVIPDGIEHVGYESFQGCWGLISVVFPNSVKSIGEYAFSGCSCLKDIYCHAEQVPSTGDYAFTGFSTNSATLHVPVTSIEDYRKTEPWNNFGTIVPLEEEMEDYVYIDGIYYNLSENEAEVTYGDNAYFGSVAIPTTFIYNGKTYSVISIGEKAFYNCTDLTSITIPNSVTSIRSSAFMHCHGLTSVTMGNNVTSIGDFAFYTCSNLISITIPNSVTDICYSSFDNCGSLTSVTIGNGVTSIGDYAFQSCTGLTDVYCFAENVPHTNSHAFYYSRITSATLHVPAGSLEAYSTTEPWSGFRTIVALPNATYILTYIVDGEVYKTYEVKSGETIIPEPAPVRKGMTFSGWGEVPETMPAYDLTLSGTFSWSKEIVDGVIYQVTDTLSNYASVIDTEGLDGAATIMPDVEIDGYLYTVTRIEENALPKTMTIYIPVGKLLLWLWENGYEDIRETDTGRNLAAPKISLVSVTSSSLTLSYKNEYPELTETVVVSGSPIEKGEDGYDIVLKGLEPDNLYEGLASLTLTIDDASYTKSFSFRTEPLTLATQQPKIVSLGNVVVAANSNLDDGEANVGFEWRRTDWTEDFASNFGTAYLYEGTMEGYIRSLNIDKLWKYRPYYESNAGSRYYGNWVGIDPTNISYFEPTVHTYATVTVQGNLAEVWGYVMRGTDNITIQGFIYWNISFPSSRRNANGIPADAKTVLSSGNVMSAKLEGLEYETEYCCVAFVTTSEGETFYGETQTFKTGEVDPDGIKEIESLTPALSNGEGDWYDLSGRKIDKPQKGINIIRYSDGTSKKVLIK